MWFPTLTALYMDIWNKDKGICRCWMTLWSASQIFHNKVRIEWEHYKGRVIWNKLSQRETCEPNMSQNVLEKDYCWNTNFRRVHTWWRRKSCWQHPPRRYLKEFLTCSSLKYTELQHHVHFWYLSMTIIISDSVAHQLDVVSFGLPFWNAQFF